MFKYFWLTRTTMNQLMPGYKSFTLFGPTHLFLLFIAFSIITVSAIYYSKLDETGKNKFKIILTALMIADEFFKYGMAIFTDQWEWGFLPLHLCSINIIVSTIQTIKKNSITSELLYSTCIPGATLALFMPTWNDIPIISGMGLHSGSIHMFLILYAILVLCDGYKPDLRKMPRFLGILILEAIPLYFLNKALGTNFFFLNYTDGNPVLEIFKGILGPDYFFLGMPFLAVFVWFFMYLPWEIIRVRKSGKNIA